MSIIAVHGASGRPILSITIKVLSSADGCGLWITETEPLNAAPDTVNRIVLADWRTAAEIVRAPPPSVISNPTIPLVGVKSVPLPVATHPIVTSTLVVLDRTAEITDGPIDIRIYRSRIVRLTTAHVRELETSRQAETR